VTDRDAFADSATAARFPSVLAPSASAISTGDGATGSPARVVPVIVTVVTYGVVAGIVALVVGNVGPETSLPVWPTVGAGCAVGFA